MLTIARSGIRLILFVPLGSFVTSVGRCCLEGIVEVAESGNVVWCLGKNEGEWRVKPSGCIGKTKRKCKWRNVRPAR